MLSQESVVSVHFGFNATHTRLGGLEDRLQLLDLIDKQLTSFRYRHELSHPALGSEIVADFIKRLAEPFG